MSADNRIPEELNLPPHETFREINPGAEKWLKKVTPVLDHGYIYLKDYLGTDHSIAESARVSYGLGTKKVNEDEGLIRYLMRNRHTSPFEMAELKFHIKLPIVIAAQMVRHRTASLNGLSGRYSIMDDEFYFPAAENVALQSTSNRQGRGDIASPELANKFRNWLITTATSGYQIYEEFLSKDNIAKELARMGLSQNLYTQWYWKCDLHNIFHFLSLRLDKHAQYEIQEYARPMAQIVKDSFPIAHQAFEDYELNANRFSAPELNLIKTLLMQNNTKFTKEQVLAIADSQGLKNKTERGEMLNKFRELGIIE